MRATTQCNIVFLVTAAATLAVMFEILGLCLTSTKKKKRKKEETQSLKEEVHFITKFTV